jgi:hypothetical protein
MQSYSAIFTSTRTSEMDASTIRRMNNVGMLYSSLSILRSIHSHNKVIAHDSDRTPSHSGILVLHNLKLKCCYSLLLKLCSLMAALSTPGIEDHMPL